MARASGTHHLASRPVGKGLTIDLSAIADVLPKPESRPPDSFTVAEFAASIGKGRSIARDILNGLMRDGRVRRVGVVRGLDALGRNYSAAGYVIVPKKGGKP